ALGGGIVEFVAIESSGPGQGAVVEETTIAEDALGAVDAGGGGQKAGHGVADAGFVDEGIAQDHKATALSVNERIAVAGGDEAGFEFFGGGESWAVEFGIAAGEEYGVGIR